MSPRSVSYIDKSREYYAVQGYPEPYRWADNDDVPFATLPKSLSHCRVGLITTTTPLEAGLDRFVDLTGDFIGVFRDCLDHLMSDPDSAVGLFEFEVRDAFIYIPDFIEMAEAMPERHSKPFLVINSFTGARNDAIAQRLLDSGVPWSTAPRLPSRPCAICSITGISWPVRP